MSAAGFIGAVLFLALGVIELAIVKRALYPALRWRHERAKTTQEHGMEPNRIMVLVKFQCLILMPLLGYLLGSVAFVRNNLEPILIGIVLLSVLPIAFEFWRKRRALRS